jgi:propionyl-CoA synthetase
MGTETLRSAFERSLKDPVGFWSEAAEDVHWHKRWEKALDDTRPPFHRWFVGGEMNTCYNALDVHVEEGRGSQLALVYDSPVTNSIKTFTYLELRDKVARFAGALASLGVGKGDRVIIYMPMIPEAVVAMLACARLGAVHSVVFGGFAANELATRIDDAQPKVVISASCGIEAHRVVSYKPLVDEAIRIAVHKPKKCVIVQREKERAALVADRDCDWDVLLEGARPHECVPVASTDPLYILYTSGTTGQPKGVVRDNGGHLVALKWTMKNIYGVEAGDVFWAASDVGWVVGHSYIVYGPLFNGNTTILYEGKPVGTPDAGAFWRVIAQHKVKVMFTAPTAFRAIKKEDPAGTLIKNYDFSNFRALFLAGERCDTDTLHWAEKHLQVPVIDHWWQTETGWPISAHCLGMDAAKVKAGSSGKPVPGMNVRVLNPENRETKPGEIGALAIRLPLPPGTFSTLWNADERFIESYFSQFPGYYATADAGYMDEDGYVYVMARTDDVFNVAGHRLSTGAIEEVLASHANVAECAVIGAHDELKGQLPVGLLVLKSGVDRDPDRIVAEVVEMVRQRIGPVAAFKAAVIVPALPKTRSGKILRGTMKRIADGQEYRVPATIEDPAVLTEIGESLQRIGYAKKPSSDRTLVAGNALSADPG